MPSVNGSGCPALLQVTVSPTPGLFIGQVNQLLLDVSSRTIGGYSVIHAVVGVLGHGEATGPRRDGRSTLCPTGEGMEPI